MKMDKDFAIVAGVLFVVILLTLAFSTEGISGFYKTSRGLAEYPYEGFSSLQEAYEMREGMDEEEEEEEGFQSFILVQQLLPLLQNKVLPQK
jgi:hypothetical protein